MWSIKVVPECAPERWHHMRTVRRTTALVLTCLLAGAALAGCGGGADDAADKSAADLLDEANATMGELSSLTIEITNEAGDDTATWRMTTDLKSRCQVRNTFSGSGTLETDPDRRDGLRPPGHEVPGDLERQRSRCRQAERLGEGARRQVEAG